MSRIRANQITNQSADGAPTVQHGLIIAGVTTVTTLDLNGDLDVDGHLNADNVSIAGVVTATSFVGSGANLTNLPVPTTITVADESSDTTCNPLFVTTTSGNLAPKTGTNLVFNSASGNLRTGSLFLGTATNESKTQDGLILERNSGDGAVHITAGRSGGNYGQMQFYVAGASGVTKRHQIDYQSNFRWYAADGTTERLRIDSSGRIQLGSDTSNLGAALVNIVTGGENGISLGRLQGAHVSSGDVLGTLAFQTAVGGQTTNSAEASIKGIAAENSTGTTAATDMAFFTKRSGIGPGSSPIERMRIRSDGHVQLQHGLTGLSGGGVIVCAAKSSTGTANQSNYKVDFVVPMGDLGTKQEYEDIRAQFGSGQTATDWSHALGGSGILIATVQNNYYWGFRTKIYHITTYGNSSNNVTQLNLLHNYSAAGHGGNSAAVDLAVQSHDGKTPKLRATFSGDYWNSNVLTVTYIGSAVASTGNIRQLTTFDSKLTGQDPTWK